MASVVGFRRRLQGTSRTEDKASAILGGMDGWKNSPRPSLSTEFLARCDLMRLGYPITSPGDRTLAGGHSHKKMTRPVRGFMASSRLERITEPSPARMGMPYCARTLRVWRSD